MVGQWRGLSRCDGGRDFRVWMFLNMDGGVSHVYDDSRSVTYSHVFYYLPCPNGNGGHGRRERERDDDGSWIILNHGPPSSYCSTFSSSVSIRSIPAFVPLPSAFDHVLTNCAACYFILPVLIVSRHN